MEEQKATMYKGSKKSKRSWRKHADIADIEEHLEEVRRDERTGGSVSDKADDALFFVEKKHDDQEKKTGRKKTVGIEADENDDEEYVPRKKRFTKKLTKEAEEMERKKIEGRKAQVKTIWGQDVMAVTDAFLESTVKKEKVKPKTVNVGKSDVAAVIVAESGASYNPDYVAHQELLLKAHTSEVHKKTAQEKLNKKVRMVSVSRLKKQSKLWLKEMSEGLSQSPDVNETQDDGKEHVKPPPPVSAENRKTKQQRSRKLIMKKMEQQKLEQKRNKVKLNDVFRLKSLKREIRRTTDKSSLVQKGRNERKTTHENKTKRLSKHKFMEGDVNYQLSEDLSGSLRELKPEGSLLKDGFKSLQRRNIIETRNLVLPHKRYKRKIYVRRSYKSQTIRDFKPKRR